MDSFSKFEVTMASVERKDLQKDYGGCKEGEGFHQGAEGDERKEKRTVREAKEEQGEGKKRRKENNDKRKALIALS